MSRIPGTADGIKRIDDNSLFTKSSRIYNQQKLSNNDFLVDARNSLNLIDPEILSEENLSTFIKRLDDYTGYYSTQQIENIDFDKFENHVFFDSAVSKVSYSFDNILNSYPYDKSEFDYIKYINSLDGYTKFILDNKFPHFLGCVNFIDNIKVLIKDKKGSIFNDYKPKKEENVIGSLNPKKSRYSFNFWIKPIKNFIYSPYLLNNQYPLQNNQVVFKKIDNNNGVLSGYICYLSKLNDDINLNFKIINGTKSTVSKTTIVKISDWNDSSWSDKWYNIHINVSNLNSLRKISFFINNSNVDDRTTQTDQLSVDEVFTDSFNSSDFVIGNSENIPGFTNLSRVYIDEFKFYTKLLSQKNIEKQYQKNIFSERGLRLYLKFNESNTDFINNEVLLDSSGNKLHGKILNNDNSLINSSSIDTYKVSVEDTNIGKPLKLENKLFSPTIFPSHNDIISTRSRLIENASKYDKVNPNIIFNLIPKYYFLESSDLQNLPIYSNEKSINYNSEDGLKVNSPANNHLVNILVIWARFFDQLKLYIDSLIDITNLSYENITKFNINGIILPIACKKLGFEFKELLSSPNKLKLEGNKLTYEDIISERSLRQIQNNIWKRILINSKDYISSKGTKNSLKAIFNSFGVDHDKFFTLREFSDMNIIDLTKSGKRKNQHYMFFNFLNFEKSIILDPIYDGNLTNQFSNNLPYINIKSNNGNNDFFFNKNWSIELYTEFSEIVKVIKNTQSLLRIDLNENNVNKPILNLYIKRENSETDYFDLILDFSIKINGSNEKKTITINKINMFEGVKYINISQKEIQYNEMSTSQKVNSSEYDKFYKFEIFLKDSGYNNIGRKHIISNITAKFKNNEVNENFFMNNTDKRISIGCYNYSINTEYLTSNEIDTTFQGKVNAVRLWNKELSRDEKYFHNIDLKNIGEDIFSPGNNLQFNYQFSKEIQNTDVQQKTFNLKSFYNKTDFLSECIVGIPDVEKLNTYNKIIHLVSFSNTLKIDEPDIENKVSILSYNDEYYKKEENNFNKYPIHSIPDDFFYQNDKRFSVEVSNVKFLNNDISKLIASTSHFTNSIVNSSSLYDYEYSSIKEFRKSYFNRLDKEIDHKILLNFFKYFDNSLQEIIKNSIPTNVGNSGFNFIYESHALERHKYEYKMSDNRVSNVEGKDVHNFSKKVDITYKNLFQEV